MARTRTVKSAVDAVNQSTRRLCLVDLSDLTVLAISESGAEYSGRPPESIVGTDAPDHIVDPDSVRASLRLLVVGGLTAYETSRTMRHVSGDVVEVRLRVCLLPTRAQPGAALVSIRPVDSDDEIESSEEFDDLVAGPVVDRATGLERQLLDLLAEIHDVARETRMAAVRRPAGLPAIADVTARQWEVVTMLIQGVRVPEIAEALYLSQSTVRNHLRAVYRVVGVTSQVDLIHLLTSRLDDGPSRGS